MPILNPERVLTVAGRTALLAYLNGDAISGPFFGAKAYGVVDAVLDPVLKNVTAVTLGDHGLQTGVDLADFGAPVMSPTGKLYIKSGLIDFSVTAPIAPQTVVGVLIGPDAVAANALAYLQLADGVTLDETGETLELVIEMGFDGQAFYVTPRVIPLGV